MTQGRFWLASLAGGVTLFFAGYLLWGILLMAFFEAHAGTATGVAREAPDLIHLALGQWVWGVFLAVAIGRWARTEGFASGLKIGATAGFLMSLSVGLTQFSMTNLFDITTALTDPFVAAVWSGLGGGVVGWVLGRGRAESS